MGQAEQPRRCPRVVARRDDLHGRGLQGAREVHLRKGRSIEDPTGLFNSVLDGGTRRAIDVREGEKLDERAFKALISEAVALNQVSRRKR